MGERNKFIEMKFHSRMKSVFNSSSSLDAKMLLVDVNDKAGSEHIPVYIYIYHIIEKRCFRKQSNDDIKTVVKFASSRN